MSTINNVQQPFTITDRVETSTGKGGLTMISLFAPGGEATLSLQGGQLLSYQPTGQDPVLWLSSQSSYESAKAIRGGIPVCWPWFGNHPTDPQLPAHGFARTALWQPIASDADPQSTRLTLELQESEDTLAMWPHRFNLQLDIQLDQQLRVTLTSHNSGDSPMIITEALHSYLQLTDIHQAQLQGLENHIYLDKTDHLKTKQQPTPINISNETDRVYQNTEQPLDLYDSASKRTIRIAKSGSRSSVVWNPWQLKAKALADFDDDGYRQMLCVEAANVLDNAVRIEPGGSHQLSCTISVVTD